MPEYINEFTNFTNMTKKTLKIPHQIHSKLDQIRVQKNQEKPEHRITFADVISDLIEEADYNLEKINK